MQRATCCTGSQVAGPEVKLAKARPKPSSFPDEIEYAPTSYASYGASMTCHARALTATKWLLPRAEEPGLDQEILDGVAALLIGKKVTFHLFGNPTIAVC